ncbi:MAG: hypothetical protein A2289_25695 [Deltaproteobacteria bacterium RIFOXYA12_FULL_58_15]|nr:MAG: hypothetical protein A2289_25695 [Deltaproteobacteria bacterium RIFOXYA12_FULL_58_15]
MGVFTAVLLGIACATAAHQAASSRNQTTGSGFGSMAMHDSDHFADGSFRNLLVSDDAFHRKGVFSAMWQFLTDGTAIRVPTEPVPIVAVTRSRFAEPPASGLCVTWLGHSTLLVEIDGYRILTDPLWGKRASPVGFAGPTRFFEPPLAIDDLPELDLVVISHDHHDHLDPTTIKALRGKVPLFVVPLGVGEYLRDWDVASEKIRELDWWQETAVGGLRLACTPARHFSGRGMFDRNSTLWASWSIIGPTHRAYFSGDGGMSPSFADIGRVYGPFDVTMMEVGAYHSNWSDIHNGPEQATQAHLDLRGKMMIPIHWGTFNLSLHAWTEPIERLLIATANHGVDLATPRPGESVEYGGPTVAERWWPAVPWKTAAEKPIISPGLPPQTASSQRDPWQAINRAKMAVKTH